MLVSISPLGLSTLSELELDPSVNTYNHIKFVAILQLYY